MTTQELEAIISGVAAKLSGSPASTAPTVAAPMPAWIEDGRKAVRALPLTSRAKSHSTRKAAAPKAPAGPTTKHVEPGTFAPEDKPGTVYHGLNIVTTLSSGRRFQKFISDDNVKLILAYLGK